jgi:tricorn protease-like protein
MRVVAVGAGFVAFGWVPGTSSPASVVAMQAQGNGDSGSPSISADGRYVGFDSAASNLVPGDTNANSDVFVRDLQTGITQRVSVSSTGVQANGGSGLTALSADGHVVAFQSSAPNLVPGDTNGTSDIFVHSLVTGTTQRVSVSSTGAQANGGSGYATLSADGNLVTFSSDASNLVAGDTNQTTDVFVHNMATGVTQRVNVSTSGAQANMGTDAFARISADGRFVAFSSGASNLVAGDTNNRPDVFVRNLATGTTVRVSVSSTGAQVYRASYAMAISADGRVIAFFSRASKLAPHDTNHQTDVFVRNRATSKTRLVSVSTSGAQANLGATVAAVSADGRVVVFESPATNLAGHDSNRVEDIFVRNRTLHRTWRVSVSSSEAQANGPSYLPAISADGRTVVFESSASNLVPGDTNHVLDVFVRDRITGTTHRVSLP